MTHQQDRDRADAQILESLPRDRWLTSRNVIKEAGLFMASITATLSLKRLTERGLVETRQENVSGSLRPVYRKLADMPKARAERPDVRRSRVICLSSAYSTTEPIEAHVSLPREPWL